MGIRSIAVHEGIFHADEVMACAFLILYGLADKEKIHRTRDPNLIDQCEFVCDVGGEYDEKKKRFDHHQNSYTGHLSSAGMILLYLKKQKMMSSELYDFYRNALIKNIDAHDLGEVQPEIGTATFSDVIANFLPIPYEASLEEKNRCFFVALDFSIAYIDRLQKRYAFREKSKKLVKKEMEKNQNFLFFDHPLPWEESFFELGGERHPALFVIMPKAHQWKLRCIPPSWKERMSMRLAHPEKWAGLFDEELSRISGIEGAVFCHKGRFISIWETKEAVFLAMQKILEGEV